MMSRIPLLAGLLVVQLVLIALMWSGGDSQPTASRLLDFEESAVTALSIEDAEGDAVNLVRADEGWLIDGVPADAGKVTGVIEALAGGSAGWPVATSESSQSRFEVTADAFQRRIRFEGASGELALLYIGTSPGFRRVHARAEGEDGVFSIDFGLHEVPTDPDDWLNKQLFRTEAITRVAFPEGQVLAAGEDGAWTLDGQAADQAAARDYVDRIERLSVLGFAGQAAEDQLGEPVVLEVEDTRGTHGLTFRFDEASDEYVLMSDRLPGEFTVASYIVEQILVPAAELLPSDEAEVPEEGPSATAEDG
jgi:hypothetical protein